MMRFGGAAGKPQVSVREMQARLASAFAYHPLCRAVQFEIFGVPRTDKGSNWTATIRAVSPEAVWEASEIVADVQEAYDLAA